MGKSLIPSISFDSFQERKLQQLMVRIDKVQRHLQGAIFHNVLKQTSMNHIAIEFIVLVDSHWLICLAIPVALLNSNWLVIRDLPWVIAIV